METTQIWRNNQDTPAMMLTEMQTDYALHTYQLLLSQIKSIKERQLMNLYASKIVSSKKLQASLCKDKNLILQGIEQVNRECNNTLEELSKQELNYTDEKDDQTNLNNLKKQKEKLTRDIGRLENAKNTKNYKEVENLLYSNLPITNIEERRKSRSSMKVNIKGKESTIDEFDVQFKSRFKKAFYSPYAKILGKRSKLSDEETAHKESTKKKHIESNDSREKQSPQLGKEPIKEQNIEQCTCIQQSKEPTREPNKESSQKPMHTHFQEPIPNPILKPMQEPAQKPIQIPAQEAILPVSEFKVKIDNPQSTQNLISPKKQPIIAPPYIENANIKPVSQPVPSSTYVTANAFDKPASQNQNILLQPQQAQANIAKTTDSKSETKKELLDESDKLLYLLKPSVDELFVYNVLTESYSKYKKSFKSPRIPLNFAICSHQKQLYISGGDKEGGVEQTAATYRIDTSSNTFTMTEITSMLLSRRQHSMATTGKYMCSLGGFNNNLGRHLRECEKFDGKSWSNLPSLREERRGISATVHGFFLFALNGAIEECPVLIFERLNLLVLKEWEKLAIANNPIKNRYLMGCISIDASNILIIGGYDKEAKSDSYLFDTDKNTMLRVANMIQCDYFYQRMAIKYGSKTFVLGNCKPYSIHTFNNGAWKVSKLDAN